MTELKTEADDKVTPASSSKFENSSFPPIGSTLLALTGVFLVSSNLWLFQPYLSSIILAFLASFPLHSIRTHLQKYLQNELEGRARDSTISFILFSIAKGFSQIILGEYTTNLMLSNLSFYLNLDYLDPNIKKPEEKEESSSSSGVKVNSENETKNEEEQILDLRFRTNGLDTFCSGLASTDWFYIVQIIRAFTIFWSFNFLFYYSLPFALISVVLILTYKFSKQIKDFSPRLQSLLSSGSKLGFFAAKKINSTLCSYINNSLNDSLTSVLVLTFTFGLIYLVSKLLYLTFGEFAESTKILIEKGSKFVYHEAKDLSERLTSETPELVGYQINVKDYANNWFQSNNRTDLDLTQIFQYLKSEEFWSKFEEMAPKVHSIVQDSYHLTFQKFFDISFLTQLSDEAKALGLFLIEHFKLDPLTDAAIVNVSFGSLFGIVFGKASSLSLSVLLLVFDLLFQLIVFITTLSYLVRSDAPPHQPIKRILYTALGQNFETNRHHQLEKDIVGLIQGLWLTTFQMGLYHLLLAVVSFHVFNAPHPYYFSFIAFFLSVIPFGAPHFAAVTPCAYMYWAMGKTYSPILLFLTQYFATSWADPHFYNHIPNISSFYATLSIFLGFSVMGLKGVLLGPFLVALIPIFYQHYVEPKSHQE